MGVTRRPAEQFGPRELVELAVAAEAPAWKLQPSVTFPAWRHEAGRPFSLSWRLPLASAPSGRVGHSVLPRRPVQTPRHRAGLCHMGVCTRAVSSSVWAPVRRSNEMHGYEGEWPQFKERFARLRESGAVDARAVACDRVDFDGDTTGSKARRFTTCRGGCDLRCCRGPAWPSTRTLGCRLYLHFRQGGGLYKDKLMPAVKEGGRAAGRTSTTSTR